MDQPLNHPGKYLLFHFFLILCVPLMSQEGFFMDDWVARKAEIPVMEEPVAMELQPSTRITVNTSDTLMRISPNLFGYCLNTFYGNYYTVPALLEVIRQLDGSPYRIPAGSGSNYYFWNRFDSDGIPSDADITRMIAGKGSESYMSLDNFYRLVYDSLQSQTVNVVNYSYARYGTSGNPVAKAAGYAADWVRYDNGRTRYWEIGNENYGSWEEGYLIDTSRNQDGQPRIQTGRLYGKHFKVFADSMRKAAASMGADIKIGAVGYWGPLWQGSRSTWNREMIPECGEVCDFVSIHHYFDADGIRNVLETAKTMHEGPAQIHQWFDRDSIPRVPVALTEWNLKNSNHPPHCLNGMHAMLGIRELIRSGVGLATRWNLVWNYNDGNTHGHISTDHDHASEGNRTWGPRAPYYYFYYARRILGDRLVRDTVSGSSDLEVLSSTFSSGETGIIILNSGAESEAVNISIASFDPGSRYAWFELAGEHNNPLSEKVFVNGISSGEKHTAGGPTEHHSLPARSGWIHDGIHLMVHPYSTVFLLADGEVIPGESERMVEFELYGDYGEGNIRPLERSSVILGSQWIETDSAGRAALRVPSTPQPLTLKKPGFSPLKTTLHVRLDTLVRDTLLIKKFDLTIRVLELETDAPLSGCLSVIGGDTLLTDGNGKAFFGSVPSLFSIDLSKNGYRSPGPVEQKISQDTLLVLYLEPDKYTAGVHIFDRWTGSPLEGAELIISGDTIGTDSYGEAMVRLIPGTYPCRLQAIGYHPLQDTFLLCADTLLILSLEASLADVKFRLLRKGTPVNLATITLHDSSQITNNLGMASYRELEAPGEYAYEIEREKYLPVSGSLYLRTDTTIQVEMEDDDAVSSSDDAVPGELKIRPNPAGKYLYCNVTGSNGPVEIRVYDLHGRCVLMTHSHQFPALLDTTPLQTGIYQICWKSKYQMITGKIIIHQSE